MKLLVALLALAICVAGCKKNAGAPSPDIISFTPTSGAAGIVVYIHGTHFDSVASHITVNFNGVTAKLYNVSDTEISVEVPNGATTGKISVTVSGRTGTSANDFTILTNGKWTQLADFPTPSGDPVGRGLDIGFAINGKGYVGLGTANGGDYSDLYEYDPSSNSWSQKASLGFGLEGAVCMVLNNNAYIGISQSSTFSSDTKQFWQYSPASDSWTRMADFPGGDTREGVGLVINNLGYVGFGLTNSSNAWWQYNPVANQWTQKANFPGTPILSWPVGFTLNNKAYVIGQAAVSTDYQCWQYDPSTDTWTQKNNYPGSPFALATAYTIGSKGYVMGGGEECWQYNDTNDTWVQMPFFTIRVGGTGFAIGNYGYFGTGNSSLNGLATDFWQFSPSN